MGQTWNKEAEKNRGFRAKPEPMGIVEPHTDNGEAATYAGSRPLPPISTGSRDTVCIVICFSFNDAPNKGV